MKTTALLLYVFMFHVYSSFSQQVNADSLEAILQLSSLNDTNSVWILNSLCAEYKFSKTKQSMDYAQKGKEISEKMGYKLGVGLHQNNIGEIYLMEGSVDKALLNYMDALRIFEQLKNKQGIADSYNNVGRVFNANQDYDKALEYYKNAWYIYEQINDVEGTSNVLNNIGVIFYYKNELDSALLYYKKSMTFKEVIGVPEDIALSNNNIGFVYEKKNNYFEALNYYFNAKDIYTKLNNKNGIAAVLTNIGAVYVSMNRDSAIVFLNQSMDISREINYKPRIADNYEVLKSYFEKKGDYENAYKYQQLFVEIKDSIFNEESNKQIAEMQTKYETEKKEKEIALQKSELEKKGVEIKQQTTQKLAFAGGFGLMLLLALVVFRNYKQKQKANLLLSAQKQEIETKNADLENANVVIREKSELLHESLKDITDSITYGSYIQQAILPEQGLFNHLFPEAFILYKPRDIVSGDFYQVAEDDESVYLLTADCTGHGVPGAFMSILGATLFNDALHLKQPDLILAEMRNGIVKALKQNTEIGGRKEGMDCSLLRINREKQILEIAAANNPVYLVRQGELLKIEPDSMPVGISDFGLKPFALQCIPMQAEDMVFALTDGYVDQFGGPKGKKFKTGQLKPLLVEIAPKPLAEQKTILENTLSEWKGMNDQVDDISMIGLRI